MLIALAAVLATAASIVGHHARPNVILITVDTLRADRLSAYGYDRHRTPNFDRLAEEGVLFEHAFCDVTWTTPSMASVMTGKYAPAHGLRTSFQFLDFAATTLAEVLHDAGYRTAAIVASYPLHSIYGLGQGFRTYDEKFSQPIATNDDSEATGPPLTPNNDKVTEWMRNFLRGVTVAYRSDAETSTRVLGWLRTERHQPFFLWVHYFGPHEKPQDTDDIFEAVRRQLPEYDPDVATADVEVGRVLTALDELGLTADTAVILHADHGQSLLEHDYFGHGRFLYDTGQEIPLLLRFPGRVPAKRRVATMARNVDIFPTILELMGVRYAGALDGVSLVGAIDGESPVRDEETYAETYLSANWLFADVIDSASDARLGFRRLGWRTRQWKFIMNDPVPTVDREGMPIDESIRREFYTEELYDLAADPGETTNVINAHSEVANALRDKIWRMQRSTNPATPTMTLAPSTRQRLQSLGYLGN